MKPQNAFITDRVFYSEDGQWGFLRNVDTKYQTVPTASGSQLGRMETSISLKFQQITDALLNVSFVQSTTMADKSASCQGAVAAAFAGHGAIASDTQNLNQLYQDMQPQRLMFTLTK